MTTDQSVVLHSRYAAITTEAGVSGRGVKGARAVDASHIDAGLIRFSQNCFHWLVACKL